MQPIPIRSRPGTSWRPCGPSPCRVGGAAWLGGVTAELVDELASLGHALPWMALVICLATFVLLFGAFGSVVLPVKAILANALSLTATFGVIVWIFADGH